jgi:hypothetical protein
LATDPEVIWRAEVLERAEACHGVELPEPTAFELPCVAEMDVEAVAAAGQELRPRERHADAGASTPAGEIE